MKCKFCESTMLDISGAICTHTCLACGAVYTSAGGLFHWVEHPDTARTAAVLLRNLRAEVAVGRIAAAFMANDLPAALQLLQDWHAAEGDTP